MKDLQNYTSAIRDVGLNSTPMRSESGQYRWSNGQLEILNIAEYSELRSNKHRIDQLDVSLRGVAQEILAYETPVKSLEEEGAGTSYEDTDELNDFKIQLHQNKSALSQLDKDLLMRGYIPPAESTEIPEMPVPEKPSKVTSREVMGFLLVWLVGEIFMTYVQWNSLRDGKGMEEMIVRSISFGVVLFLIHLVGRYHQQQKRLIQKIFLVFSFVMLFTMLLAPLILHEMYPENAAPASSGNGWSLSGEPAAVQENTNTQPFLVSFYLSNDMLPGIFVFLFFVIMQTFSVRKKPEPVATTVPVSKIPASAQNEIEEKRQYFLEQIQKLEQKISSMDRQRHQSLEPNTRRLEVILNELQSRKTVLDSIENEQRSLGMQNERLLRKLEMHLNRYHTEYQSVLQNDPVKSLVIKPEWPTILDLRSYFALN